MQKIEFSISIQATPSKVWEALWQDANYREWTNVFYPGSHAVSDWKEGSKIQFLSPEGGGMYSVIDLLKPNTHMRFKHIGEVKNGEEQPLTEVTKAWSGCIEEYFLKQENNTTLLEVRLDAVEEHVDYFNDAFPKGLETVKAIAERN